MLGQIEFNNIKTYDDFNFKITNISITDPEPNLILVSVPYSNGVYDFSSIATGDITYNTREITVELELNEYESYQERLNVIYYALKNVLYTNEFKNLKIDWIEGIFTARVKSISSLELLEEDRKVEVTFIAQPFRQLEHYEGDDIWDNINFETDIFQDNTYDVEGSLNISLYNLGVKRCTPDIITNASGMSIIYKNKEYLLQGGSNKNKLILDKGKNDLTIKGTGNIVFLWKREVI